MENEMKKLRMEFKTDIDLIAIRHGMMAKKLDEMADGLEAQGQQIAEQGQQIAEQGQRIAEQGQRIAAQGALLEATHRESAKRGRELSESNRWTEGRLRLMGQRFDRILEIAEQEYTTKATVDALTEQVQSLAERVERLEKDRPPAA